MSTSDTVTLNKATLMRLIYQHEQAIRDYAYARGVRDGLKHTASFCRPTDICILDYANDADIAEAALYDYINNNNNNNMEKGN